MTRPRILLLSLFHPELIRGGAQQIAYELFESLRDSGDVDVTFLAAIDRQFTALYKSGARITGFDGRAGEYLLLTRDYDYVWHKTGAPAVLESLEEFLLQIAPDIVHVHHFLLFGIDVLTLIRRVLPRCRLVFTFHEFMAICAADGHMVRRTDGSLCTHASQIRCHQCFPERGPEQFLLRKLWFTQHLSHVDAFTVPSRFMIGHYTRWGIPAEKITQVTNGQRNYADSGHLPPASPDRRRFGFFGQYVNVKGVQIILRAVALLRAEGFTDFTVDLNGDNLRYATPAIRAEFEAFFEAEDARPVEDRIVTNRGSYEVTQLQSRMSRVDWCIVPSTWWESFGLVVSEAWMFGRPIICSNAGGLAERNPARRSCPAIPTRRPPCTRRNDLPRLHRRRPMEPPSRQPSHATNARGDAGRVSGGVWHRRRCYKAASSGRVESKPFFSKKPGACVPVTNINSPDSCG